MEYENTAALQKKEYPALDIAKLAMAIVVVLINRPLLKDGLLRFLMSDNSMLSVAVPFFFVTSSFLFFRKLRQPGIEPKKALVRFEKRLLLEFVNSTVLAAYRQWIEDRKQIPLEDVIGITNRAVLGGVDGFFGA